MISLHALFPTVALGFFAITAEAKIQWTPSCATECTSLTTVPIECATLDVPFDYTANDPNDTLTLNLLRAPAPLKSKGSILTNPGGPGLPGRNNLAQLASILIPYVKLPSRNKVSYYTILY